MIYQILNPFNLNFNNIKNESIFFSVLFGLNFSFCIAQTDTTIVAEVAPSFTKLVYSGGLTDMTPIKLYNTSNLEVSLSFCLAKQAGICPDTITALVIPANGMIYTNVLQMGGTQSGTNINVVNMSQVSAGAYSVTIMNSAVVGGGGTGGTLPPSFGTTLGCSVGVNTPEFRRAVVPVIKGTGTTTSNHILKCPPEGNTGFGLESSIPVNKIDVVGSAAIGRSFAGAYTAPAQGLIVQGGVGLGIGTPNPFNQLEIAGNSSIRMDFSLNFGQGYTNDTQWGKYALQYLKAANGNPGGLNFWVPGVPGNNFANYILFLNDNGNVGIGTAKTGSNKLAVEGIIAAREIKILMGPFPDYVFDKDYKLMNLTELGSYVEHHHHLPGLPSAKEVEKNEGVALGELNRKLLEKIEELTLYILKQEKDIESLKRKAGL